MISRNASEFNEAPPTNPPSTSGQLKISLELLGLRLPPYTMGIISDIFLIANLKVLLCVDVFRVLVLS